MRDKKLSQLIEHIKNYDYECTSSTTYTNDKQIQSQFQCLEQYHETNKQTHNQDSTSAAHNRTQISFNQLLFQSQTLISLFQVELQTKQEQMDSMGEELLTCRQELTKQLQEYKECNQTMSMKVDQLRLAIMDRQDTIANMNSILQQKQDRLLQLQSQCRLTAQRIQQLEVQNGEYVQKLQDLQRRAMEKQKSVTQYYEDALQSVVAENKAFLQHNVALSASLQSVIKYTKQLQASANNGSNNNNTNANIISATNVYASSSKYENDHHSSIKINQNTGKLNTSIQNLENEDFMSPRVIANANHSPHYLQNQYEYESYSQQEPQNLKDNHRLLHSNNRCTENLLQSQLNEPQHLPKTNTQQGRETKTKRRSIPKKDHSSSRQEHILNSNSSQEQHGMILHDILNLANNKSSKFGYSQHKINQNSSNVLNNSNTQHVNANHSRNFGTISKEQHGNNRYRYKYADFIHSSNQQNTNTIDNVVYTNESYVYQLNQDMKILGNSIKEFSEADLENTHTNLCINQFTSNQVQSLNIRHQKINEVPYSTSPMASHRNCSSTNLKINQNIVNIHGTSNIEDNPYYIFFVLTTQCVKINSGRLEQVADMNLLQYWNLFTQKKVPLHEWSTILERKLFANQREKIKHKL